MEPLVFRYRGRELNAKDISFIRAPVHRHYAQGRTRISQILCNAWQWVQPNGKPKEYAVRDLLLRLEERGFIELPPRIRRNNNRKKNSFAQIPFFPKTPLGGSAGDYQELCVRLAAPSYGYLWDYLVHHYHYLGLPTLVGEHLRHLVFLNGQVVACLAWASAAWKLRAREQFIGWNESTKRKNLHLIANNTRFLILPWITVKYLASKALSLSIRRLRADWEKTYGHPVYLAETFVDITRFHGTCYRAANWIEVGTTSGSAKRGNSYRYQAGQRLFTCIPCILTLGGILPMSRDEAMAILRLPTDQAVDAILALAEKAEKYDQLYGYLSPTTPSGMTPTYLKASPRKRRKRPGREKGHEGISRIQPEEADHVKAHTLQRCPECHALVKEPVTHYKRYTEDIPPLKKPEVTEHTVYGYWCPQCKKIVFAPVTDALPHAVIGLRLVVFTAWLHYLVGVSVNNIVRILSVVCHFKISSGGLTQAWKNLSLLIEPLYHDIGQRISQSAVLNADETGWRLNGITHWLWCFTTKELSWYLITKSRGSPVLKELLGAVFRGIIICEFWGAYNKISALAKQRCSYHLFTELAKVDKTNASPEWKAFRKNSCAYSRMPSVCMREKIA
jgi:hypothetical protein